MLATKRLAGVAPEVNLKERVTRMPPPSSNNATHTGFEAQRRRHQKSETGVSVAPEMDMCPTKKLKKEKRKRSNLQVVRPLRARSNCGHNGRILI